MLGRMRDLYVGALYNQNMQSVTHIKNYLEYAASAVKMSV